MGSAFSSYFKSGFPARTPTPNLADARAASVSLPRPSMRSSRARAGGRTVTITSVVADLTGRPPRTLKEFVRDLAAAFRG